MRRVLGKFRKSDSGLAAVEFAFLLPVMITLFFGIVEVSLGLSCRADVNSVASTTADLVAQASSVSNADMTNVFNASSAILYPNNTSSTVLKIVVTSVIDTGSTSSGKVDWSTSSTGSGARASGSTVSLPSGLMTSGGSVILSEVTYTYTSPTTQVITGPISMTNSFYTKPRRVAQIVRTT